MATSKRKPNATKRQPKSKPNAKAHAKPKVVKVKRLGSTVVQQMNDGTNILNVRPEMHEDGLQRLISSKRFENLKQVGDVIREGTMKVLARRSFESLAIGVKFWHCAPYVKCIPENECLKYYAKLDDNRAKVVESGQVITIRPDAECLVDSTVNYSFTIKQVAGNSATNMATAKKAAKKAATKKTAKKAAGKKQAAKAGRKGTGIIAKIREYAAKGLSNKEIVAKGFNATTVSIQAAKYRREG